MKKSAYLADESDPGRITGQEYVVAAVEREEPGSGNAAGDESALLEWYRGVIATMQHERGRGDAREKVEDIEFSKRPQQPGCILGRGGKPPT